jgi:serine/threonine protein kinase
MKRMSDRERKTSPGAKDSAAPPSDTADSFLRAAAELSEPSPSVVDEAHGRGSHAPAAARVAGEIIAKRYRLDEELGRGGMGVVWAATHVVTRRRVAIKFLRGPAELRTDMRRRFLREARAASAVDHPNVVEVIDVFELEDETPVIVMELLIGETLRDRLAREQKMPLGQAASILLPVVSAVGSGHAVGIVHRDLKPENIFLVRGSAGVSVKVLDFGIAKLLTPDANTSETDSLTGTGSMLGTPCYMAPEQTLGEKGIDHRADIWAIGVILYECLAGVRPVQGSGIGQVVMKLATEGIRPLGDVVPDLPREATALVMHMLTREKAGRPQDLQQVHEVLSRFADTALPFATTVISHRTPIDERARRQLAQTPAVDTESPQSLPRGVRRKPRRSLLVGVAAMGILLVAFVGWRLSAPLPTTPPRALGGTTAVPLLGTSAPLMPALPSALPSLAGIPSEPLRATTTEAAATPRSVPNAAPPLGRPKPTSAVSSSAPATVERDAGSVPSVPPETPSARPKPAPGGLAEKPPF